MRSILWFLIRPFRRSPVLGVALSAVLVASLAASAGAAPATWSIARLSLGIDGKAAIVEGDGHSSHFYPGVYASYGLTSAFSLAGTVERDFPGKLTTARAGLRFVLAEMGNEGRLWGGVNVIGYGDEGAAGIAEATSWEATAQASYPLLWAKNGATWMWGIAAASYDEPNDRTTYRLGLRVQAIGGRPY